MEQYISKAAVVAEIEKLISNGKLKCQQSQENNDQVSYIAWSEHIATCGKILSFLNTHEEPADEDLEEFAKRESELFGEREYEVDYLDRNALTKGFYWGCKTGARWQKQQDAPEIKDANIEKIWEKL